MVLVVPRILLVFWQYRSIHLTGCEALLLASFEIYVHLSYRMGRRPLFTLAVLPHVIFESFFNSKEQYILL